MKIIFFDAKEFELPFLKEMMPSYLEVEFVNDRLTVNTATLAKGCIAISIFTNDDVSQSVINELKKLGIQLIALRAAGYDNVDIAAANAAGIHVVNVPDYSPQSVAEHAVGLMLALNRKLIRANDQVHQNNFLLNDLVGYNLHNKTVGIIGTGRIGTSVASILHGFGCTILAYDPVRNYKLEQQCNVFYTDLNSLCNKSDIITIHVPLNPNTHYLINQQLINQMKPGVMLINTSRGAVVNTEDILKALQIGRIAYFGTDVYEHEKGLFFYDHRNEQLNDPVLKSLLSCPNVIVTPHQAFATREALTNIAGTTIRNIVAWKKSKRIEHELTQIPTNVKPRIQSSELL
jgi:Lactate dehydrogenase and related dehydrogenases